MGSKTSPVVNILIILSAGQFILYSKGNPVDSNVTASENIPRLKYVTLNPRSAAFFNLTTVHKNLGAVQKLINITYNGVHRYYTIEETYEFVEPEVSTDCNCYCPRKDFQKYTQKNDDKYPSCNSSQRVSLCTEYFADIKSKNCFYGYKVFCQVLFNSDHKRSEMFTALYINEPQDTISLEIEIHSVTQHTMIFHLDIPTKVKRIIIDSEFAIEISNDTESLNSSQYVPSGYYYVNSKNEVLNRAPVNKWDEFTFNKLGWFRFHPETKEIRKIDRNILRNYLHLELNNCEKKPEFTWEFNAVNYYRDGELLKSVEGKPLLDIYSDVINRVRFKHEFVIISQNYFPKIQIRVFNPSESDEVFLAYYSKNKDNRDILVLKVPNNYQTTNASLKIYDGNDKGEEVSVSFTAGAKWEEVIELKFPKTFWVCLTPTGKEEICRMAEWFPEKIINDEITKNENSSENVRPTDKTDEKIQQSYLTPFIVTAVLMFVLVAISSIAFWRVRKKRCKLSNCFGGLKSTDASGGSAPLELEEVKVPLMSENSPADESAWLDFKNSLRVKYRSFRLPLELWFKEKNNSFENIWMEPSLSAKVSDNTWKEIRYTDLIDPSEHTEGDRIIVVGHSGSGKTGLVYKLACDWANGEDYIAKRFEAVIIIPLRYVHGPLDEEVEKEFSKGVIKLLQRNQSKILLILDGFDESDINFKHEILRVLYKECYPKMTVLMTSRFMKGLKDADFLVLPKGRSIPWDKYVFLTGLDKTKSKKLLQKYLKENYTQFENDNSSYFQEQVTGNLMKNPFYLHLVGTGIIPHTELKQFTSITKIYVKTFSYLIENQLKTHGKSSDNVNLLSYDKNTVPGYVSLLQDFGKFQVKNLIDRKYVYSLSDIKQIHPDYKKLLSLGFLKRCKRDSSHEPQFYEPVHPSFVLFCAAYYLWGKFLVDENTFETEISEMIKSHIKPTSGAMSFLFLAGLMDEQWYKLLDLFVAELPASELRACSFDEYNNHRFDTIIRLIDECKLNDSILKSLRKFLPHIWPVEVDHEFFGSDFHAKLLSYGVGCKLVTEIIWATNVRVKFPTSLELEKLAIKLNSFNSEVLSAFPKTRCEIFEMKIKKSFKNFDIFPKLLDNVEYNEIVIVVPAETKVQRIRKYFENKTVKYTIASENELS